MADLMVCRLVPFTEMPNDPNKGHFFEIQKGPFELEKPPKGPGSRSTGSLTEFVPLYSNQKAYMVCRCGISEPYFRSRSAEPPRLGRER